jgi:hypothetical protein
MTKYQNRLDYAMRIAQHKLAEKNRNQKNVDKLAFDAHYWNIVAEVLYTETVRECAEFAGDNKEKVLGHFNLNYPATPWIKSIPWTV